MKSIFSVGISGSEKEPRLTQVFTYMLKKDPEYAKFILLCLFSRNVDEVTEVIPEYMMQCGKRPDIILKVREGTSEVRIIIENKIGAGFTEEQLPKYKDEFGVSNVYLIYKYLSDVSHAREATDQRSWYNIYQETTRYSLTIADAVKLFLANEFLAYLKEIGMGIDKVNNDIKYGLESYHNLCEQIRSCIEDLMLNEGKLITRYKLNGSMNYRDWVLEDTNVHLFLNIDP